jgi:hypothetical protein
MSMREDEIVSARFMKAVAALVVLVVLSAVGASAAGALTATVVMKVARTAQDSIINEGEDLSIDVQIEGSSPSAYRWLFEGAPIAGATERVYNIESATVADAGVYRMEAYDEAGKLILSMDFSVRVVEKALPKSGDATLGLVSLVATMGASGAVAATAVAVKKRRAG